MENKRALIILTTIVLVSIVGALISIIYIYNANYTIKITSYGCNVDYITFEVVEESFTNYKVKLSSNQEFLYTAGSGKTFKMYVWKDDEWNEMKTLETYDGETEMQIINKDITEKEIYISWSDKYGNLKKGTYKLVERSMTIDEYDLEYYIEFEVQ